ncbi:hypothetical protein M514_05032 [Trichuris suis]|uniref:Uncharacterized protein n=1 Tax=Trichuris suis TaxID=68888 RepID=A0A085NCW6_9BILA|nr:hypothetical protein M513_05032 [Trichuris suis]KFD67312.1 hypothetical protein M514_05032 [Trichuris suis]
MIRATSANARRLMDPEIKGTHSRISALDSQTDAVESVTKRRRSNGACDIRGASEVQNGANVKKI